MAQYMSEEELVDVKNFIKNKRMAGSVRKFLLAGIYDQGVIAPDKVPEATRNFALQLFFRRSASNAELGEELRAAATAMEILEGAFGKMLDMVEEKKDEKSPLNKAR